VPVTDPLLLDWAKPVIEKAVQMQNSRMMRAIFRCGMDICLPGAIGVSLHISAQTWGM
jgi:hypothetical protein